jgi:hypothetical protein
LWPSLSHAQLPTPQLESLFPCGAKPGSELDVTIAGNDLDEVDKILFQHPGITSTPKLGEPLMPGQAAKPVENQFTIKVASDVPPGVYEARVTGRFGISNPRTFVVSNLEQITKTGGNNSAATAQEIKVGSVVSGRADNNNRDYYKLALGQGERVLLDCRADRIDSRMNATLVVLDSQGRELARTRDTTGRDPVVDFTAPAAGEYYAVVYDFLYGGGNDYVYRLAVHKAPYIDFVFPPVGKAGATGSFTLYGRNLPGGQPAGLSISHAPLEKLTVSIPIPADAVARQQLAVGSLLLPRTSFTDSFEYRLDSPQGKSNPVAIGITTDELILETEPNDSPATATKITVPCEVAGQFYPAADRDNVQFDAKQGDVFYIEVLAHRLGYGSDPTLTIERVTKNEQGAEVVSNVAQVDDPQDRNNRIGSDFDTSTDDPSYRLEVKEDGVYRVLVRDNFGESRTDPRMVYRLCIRRAQPDFRVVAYLDPPSPQNNNNQALLSGPVLRKGGSLELRVRIDRRDNFIGEVTVGVEGLPAGVTCNGAVLGGNVDTAPLVFTAAENAAASSSPLKITAKANINGQDVVREARYGACVWGTTNRQQAPPEFRLCGNLMLAVMDKELEPAQIVVGEDKIYETARGGNLEIPVTVKRRDNFQENIKLTKVIVPNEFNVKEVNLNGAETNGKLEIQLNNQNLPAGTYTFYMRGDTKWKYARNPDAITAIETEQKDFVEMLKQLDEALKTANNNKNTTTAAAQQAVNERNQAEQNKNNLANQAQQAANNVKAATENAAKAKAAADADNQNQGLKDAAANAQKQAQDAAKLQADANAKLTEANQALVAAQEKVKAAEEAKVAAEKAAQAAQEMLNKANQEKQKLDQRVTQVKQLNSPKDVPLGLVSSPIKVRVADSPVKINMPQAAFTVKQEQMLEVPVTIERLYGYNENAEVTLEAPGVQGLSAPKVDIAKDQTQGKLMLKTDKNTTVGEHEVTLRVRTRWNNVQADTTQTIKIKIAKADA